MQQNLDAPLCSRSYLDRLAIKKYPKELTVSFRTYRWGINESGKSR